MPHSTHQESQPGHCCSIQSMSLVQAYRPNRRPAAEIFWVDDGMRQQFLSGVLFHGAVDSLGDVPRVAGHSSRAQPRRNPSGICRADHDRRPWLKSSSGNACRFRASSCLGDRRKGRSVADPGPEDRQVPPHVEQDRGAGKHAELTHPVKHTLVREKCRLPVITARAALDAPVARIPAMLASGENAEFRDRENGKSGDSLFPIDTSGPLVGVFAETCFFWHIGIAVASPSIRQEANRNHGNDLHAIDFGNCGLDSHSVARWVRL